MSKTLYLNIPVEDTKKALDFYVKIGFSFKEEFSNPISETIVINDATLLMLVDKAAFKDAAKRDLANTEMTAEVVLAMDVESRNSVDEIADKAKELGAVEVDTAFEHEGMYTRIIRDLDGHQMNLFAYIG